MFVVAEQPERRMRADDLVLIEQRQLAFDFEHALDHEHHVRPSRVVFVEHERRRVLQRPRQHPFFELGDLLAVLDDDRIFADEIDPADVAVEVDADARPVQPRGDLFDVRRFPGAVVALNHHAAIERKARQNRQRRLRIEAIRGIDVRHIRGAFPERRTLEILIETEDLADADFGVGYHVRRQAGIVRFHRFFQYFHCDFVGCARNTVTGHEGV